MLGSQLTVFIIVTIWIIIIILMFVEILNMQNKLNKSIDSQFTNINNSQKNYPRNYDAIKDYDIRKLNDPLENPVKRPDRYTLGDVGMKQYFNLATQGYPDNFRLLGILVNSEEYSNNEYEKHNNISNTIEQNNDNKLDDKINQIASVNSNGFQSINPNRVIKLYGRQKYPGSNNQYEYYTAISMGNEMTKIHLPDKNEVYTGDEFYIPVLKQTMKVVLYPDDKMVYNPFIIN